MYYSNEIKKQILENLLEYVFSISSKEYQRRIWIEAKGPECDFYDETTEFFLSGCESILPKYKDFDITDKQYHLLKNLWDEFEAFDDSAEQTDFPQFFIDSPEWTKITELAKDVLVAFDWKPTHKL